MQMLDEVEGPRVFSLGAESLELAAESLGFSVGFGFWGLKLKG